jgi:hypothetical protein
MIAARDARTSRRIGMLRVTHLLSVFGILALCAMTEPVWAQQPPAGEGKRFETLDERAKRGREGLQELRREEAEIRQQNLEADRALCAKSKDPALCEMLATRLRGIEESLMGIDVGLGAGIRDIKSTLSTIESTIRESAIRSRP